MATPMDSDWSWAMTTTGFLISVTEDLRMGDRRRAAKRVPEMARRAARTWCIRGCCPLKVLSL